MLSGKQDHLNKILNYWCNFSGNYKIVSASSHISNIYSFCSRLAHKYMWWWYHLCQGLYHHLHYIATLEEKYHKSHFDVIMLHVQSSNFPFSVFGREKDRFSFIFLEMNAQLVIYKPVTYIGEVLCEFFFYSLQIFKINMYHLR